MRKVRCGLYVVAFLAVSWLVISPSQAPSNPPAVPLAAIFCVIRFQQSSGVASPEDVGLSSARLERIDSAIEQSINDGRIAGAVALVARHGKIAYFKAFGMADREAKKPMRTDNIFRICSMSKPITSVAVMILYEEGRFLLNEPVSDFIPEFKNMKVLDPPVPRTRLLRRAPWSMPSAPSPSSIC